MFLAPDDAPFDPQVYLCQADLSYTHTDILTHYKVCISIKTDQYLQRTTIALGPTGSELCPVATMLDFLGHAVGRVTKPTIYQHNPTPMQRRQLPAKRKKHRLRLEVAEPTVMATVFK